MWLKQNFLIIFLIIINLTSKAQHALGLEAGFSEGQLITNISNQASTVIHSASGRHFGIGYKKEIKEWMYADVRLSITDKNYSSNRIDSLSGVGTTYKNTYIQLPLMGGFIYGKKLRVLIDAGLYGAYWLSGSVHGKIPNIFSAATSANQMGEIFQLQPFKEKYIFNPVKDNRFELGWIIGSGIQYHFNSNYIIDLNCRYYQSQTDQQKRYMVHQVARYNKVVTISAGVIFLLNTHYYKK